MDQNDNAKFMFFAVLVLILLCYFDHFYKLNNMVIGYFYKRDIKNLEKFIEKHGTWHIYYAIENSKIDINSDVSKFLVEKKILNPNVAFGIAMKEGRQDIAMPLIEEKESNSNNISFMVAKKEYLKLFKELQKKGYIDINMAWKREIERKQKRIDIVTELPKIVQL